MATKQEMTPKSDMTTKFTDVNVNALDFTKLEENPRSKGQRIAYPRYQEGEQEKILFIQLPWIELKQYGIPKISEYYPDDSKRSFVKVPLDESIPEIKQLVDLIKEFDKKLDSSEFRTKIFGPKASKYKYQSIFRLPQEEDEEEKKKAPPKKDYGPKLPYFRLKIDTSYPDNNVKTILFDSVLNDGKRTRTKIENIKTIDDFSSHVCWLSKIRPVIRPVKLWAQPTNKTDPTYGLTFKIAKTEVEAPVKTHSNVKEYMQSDVFLDSDEEETIQKFESLKIQPATTTTTQVANVESDQSDEENDDEPVKPVGKTPVKVAQVESDNEESEEEIKPAKKPVATKAPVKAPTTVKAKKAAA